MSDDRTVHAVTHSGIEIVRYNRAGKWWAEGPTTRLPLTFAEAVAHGKRRGTTVHLGRPGGSRFDAAVSR